MLCGRRFRVTTKHSRRESSPSVALWGILPAFLAEVVFEGPESLVRRAVESRLRPVVSGPETEMLDPAPFSEGGRRVWRVLLRSRRRAGLAKAATLIARLAAEVRNRSNDGVKVRINMDPEEV